MILFLIGCVAKQWNQVETLYSTGEPYEMVLDTNLDAEFIGESKDTIVLDLKATVGTQDRVMQSFRIYDEVRFNKRDAHNVGDGFLFYGGIYGFPLYTLFAIGKHATLEEERIKENYQRIGENPPIWNDGAKKGLRQGVIFLLATVTVAGGYYLLPYLPPRKKNETVEAREHIIDSSTKPLSERTIRVVDSEGKVLAEGLTDKNGLVNLKFSPPEDWKAIAQLMTQDGDVLFDGSLNLKDSYVFFHSKKVEIDSIVKKKSRSKTLALQDDIKRYSSYKNELEAEFCKSFSKHWKRVSYENKIAAFKASKEIPECKAVWDSIQSVKDRHCENAKKDVRMATAEISDPNFAYSLQKDLSKAKGKLEQLIYQSSNPSYETQEKVQCISDALFAGTDVMNGILQINRANARIELLRQGHFNYGEEFLFYRLADPQQICRSFIYNNINWDILSSLNDYNRAFEKMKSNCSSLPQ